ncbi:hypothetical protein CLV84_2870 [Neolewinella xylanilytica]|uniref:Uncharacterized protein n=1 Tax=Neolewinella xylanilytica TaxID=1514080 RepID=A0A2S6I449_9BACT|nr:hypothetical protein [Neolewinella xylanilytica]PPK85957.1 hypothetical protein CLV84_2870 [Neolewinella xylanilytica]
MSANDKEMQYKSWLLKAPLGLVLTGFGASLIGAATVRKQSGAPTLHWVSFGTLALTVFNSGLSVLADAAKHRAHYERLRDAE